MKKVININFQGRVIPIEETAYEILKQYVDSLRRYFINEEGKEEIINDIESRIAELFGETLKKGSTCITDDDVNAVINSIGRPEDFDGDGEEEKIKSRVYEESTGSNYTYTKGDRLFRNENNKVIAGVCGGIAAYFGVDAMLIRILFIVCAFAGFGLLVYIVLWIAVPSTASTVIGSAKKRLLRDPEDKLIGGVCRGLAYYFGVNVWVPRAIFLIPFFTVVFRWNNWGAFHYPNFFSISFSPAAVLAYIILWIVLPEAKSSSERLEMKGEKVDLNSIKNNISNEMKGVGERVSKFGKEATAFAAETGKQFTAKGKQFGGEVSQTARRSGRGLGGVIALLIKIFVYFIVGSILVALVFALFGVGVGLIGLLPIKPYLLNDGWQTTFAWGTLLFLWVPVIGIITTVIRRLAKMKGNSSILRTSFWSLWLLGLVCVIGLLVSFSNNFRYSSNASEQNIALDNAKTEKLEVRASRLGAYYHRFNWLHIEPFADIDEDTAYINNLRVRVVKADGDSFYVKLLKMSDGSTREEANELSNAIAYGGVQKDSVLTLNKGIAINREQKFRNQHVYVTIAVPVGKRIIIDGSVTDWNGNIQFGFHNDDYWRNYDHWNGDEREYDWDHDVEYVMTKDGLKRADGKINDNDDDDNNNNDESDDDKLQEYKRSREELERKREDLLQQQQRIDSELNRYKDTLPATPKTPAIKTAVVVPAPLSISNILLSKLAI